MDSAFPSLDLDTFRVSAKPSRISLHQPYQGSPLPDVGDLLPLHFQGQESCATTQPAMTPSLSFHQHAKKLLWAKSHPVGPPLQSLPFAFPSPNKLHQARDIFSSPRFPKGHCEVLCKQRNEARQFETEEKISQPSQQHQQFRENTWSCQYPALSAERFGTYSSFEEETLCWFACKSWGKSAPLSCHPEMVLTPWQ